MHISLWSAFCFYTFLFPRVSFVARFFKWAPGASDFGTSCAWSWNCSWSSSSSWPSSFSWSSSSSWSWSSSWSSSAWQGVKKIVGSSHMRSEKLSSVRSHHHSAQPKLFFPLLLLQTLYFGILARVRQRRSQHHSAQPKLFLLLILPQTWQYSTLERYSSILVFWQGKY